MNKEAAAKVMNEFGWLSRQPLAFREDVLRRCHLSRYNAGDVIFRVGDPAGGLYGLVDGVAQVSVANDRLGSIVTRGAWFGEGAAFRRSPRLATITAAEPVILFVLPFAEFERLITNAEYCRCFALLSIDHLEESLAVAADLLLRASVPRVCGRLLALQSVGRIGDDDIKLTQADLAAMCGMTRATLSRALTQLSEEGAIELKYGRIQLLDRKILLRHVQGDDA